MKRCMILAMAMTVAVNSYGGLFDNVIKNAVGVALPEDLVKQQKVEMGALAEQIDAEIDLSPKVPGVLGWMFGEESKESANRGFVSTEWRDGDNAALNMALRQWFSKVQLEYEPDGRLGAVRLEGNVEKLTDASRLSLYRILRWLEHDFGVVQRQKAQAFLRSSDSYPHNAYFHSHNEYYEAQLDSNYDTLFLQLRDLSVRSNARAAIVAKKKLYEAERERRRAAIIAEQEERARQEELRKAEEHKAYMAKLEQEEQERMRKQAEEFAAQIAKYQQEEQERQRQREAERAEEAERRRQQETEVAERQRQREAERARERNEENNKIIANYLTTLRKANYLFASRKDAGSMNESVYESFYLTKQALENIPQFPSQPLTSGHIQLYKNICSGSSLLWSIGQLANVGQFGSHFKVTRPDGVSSATLQNYDGIAIPVDDVLLYCTVEGVDVADVERIANGNFFDVEVFGFRKKFPREVVVDDILSRMVAKYNNSEVKRKTMVSNTVLLGHPGIIRTTTQIICEFTNDAVIGHIGQESYEYNACSRKIARWFAYCEIASNLPPNHPLNVTCRSQESILSEDIVKGKYKREINAFNTDCIGWDSKRKSKEAFWAEIQAAEYAMSQHSRYNDRIQARADQMMAEATKSEEIKGMPKRGEAILYVFDKKTIDVLPQLKKERCEAVQARESAQKAEEARLIKNEALNF